MLPVQKYTWSQYNNMNEGMHKKPNEKKVASLGGMVVIFGFCMCKPSATIKKI